MHNRFNRHVSSLLERKAGSFAPIGGASLSAADGPKSAWKLDFSLPAAMTETLRVTERVETKRLVGERLREEHFAVLRALDSDRDVMATLGGLRSENETWENLRAGLEHWARNGFGPWVFHRRETGEPVATSALRRVQNEGCDEVELGYRVAAAWWGRGIATEMATALVGIARERLGLGEIVAFTLPHNLPSRRVMEKVGFRYERDIEWAALRHVLYRRRLRDSTPDRGMS